VGGGFERRRHPGQRAVAWSSSDELAKEALGEDGLKAYGAMTALQRMADPAEIGAAAAFLDRRKTAS
jgi:hypothetical protein